MMILLLATLAFGTTKADIVWSGPNDNTSGETIGDPTFEDLKWQIAIYNGDFMTQVRVCYEVVANFIEETIDYVLSNMVRDNYTTEEQFEEHKRFFEVKIREFKANYDGGVSHMDAYFGIRKFYVDINEEY